MTALTPAGRTVFVTGGTSGIGLGLARAFMGGGAQVSVLARDPGRLADPGALDVIAGDVADARSLREAAEALIARRPALDGVIANAGVQRMIDFAGGEPQPDALAEEVAINLSGVLNTAALFLPHLKRRSQAWLVVVGSGLGYVPLVKAPVYSATKAAVHAFATTLREQLRATSVRVVTLVPPVVETNLHAGLERKPPRAMPLNAFVAAAMRGFASGSDVVDVGGSGALRVASRLAPAAVRRALNRAAG